MQPHGRHGSPGCGAKGLRGKIPLQHSRRRFQGVSAWGSVKACRPATIRELPSSPRRLPTAGASRPAGGKQGLAPEKAEANSALQHPGPVQPGAAPAAHDLVQEVRTEGTHVRTSFPCSKARRSLSLQTPFTVSTAQKGRVPNAPYGGAPTSTRGLRSSPGCPKSSPERLCTPQLQTLSTSLTPTSPSTCPPLTPPFFEHRPREPSFQESPPSCLSWSTEASRKGPWPLCDLTRHTSTAWWYTSFFFQNVLNTKQFKSKNTIKINFFNTKMKTVATPFRPSIPYRPRTRHQ